MNDLNPLAWVRFNPLMKLSLTNATEARSERNQNRLTLDIILNPLAWVRFNPLMKLNLTNVERQDQRGIEID